MSLVQAISQQPLSFSSCTTGNIAIPGISGVTVAKLEANVVEGVSGSLPRGLYIGHGPTEFADIAFCNVSVTYSHPGHDDPIHVQIWLPSADAWNQRLMAMGGGGWAAGPYGFLQGGMQAAVSEGYVTLATDAGHDSGSQDPSWGLDKSGKVNTYLLETLAHTSLNDMASIGKAVTKAYYGTTPRRSYFNGCSQGGRQGLALAQRYPEAFDGILAFAPAINWVNMLPSLQWPQLVMDEMKQFPRGCEIDALTTAAIQECDSDDGVRDSIISNPQACKFNPYDLVGTMIDCPSISNQVEISEAAAKVAQATWTGAVTRGGRFLWYGLSHDAELSNVAKTICPEEGESPCLSGQPLTSSLGWFKYFLAKNAKFDPTQMSHEALEKLWNISVNEYKDVIDTSNPNLSRFREAGGKMITVHGLSDPLIAPKGTAQYFDQVLALDSNARDFYRHFEAPGIGHCLGGPGPYPDNAFEDLVTWVEQGHAPDTLLGRTQHLERPLCQYPSVARHDGSGGFEDPKHYDCDEEYLSATPISLVIQRTKRYLSEVMTG